MWKHILGDHLLEEEKKQCIDSLRMKNTILATAVVKLFKTSPPNHNEWEEMGAGALMFVKDSAVRSHFIKFQPLTKVGKPFEQELYGQMKLNQLADFFLSVEGEGNIIGIMFSFKEEYNELYTNMKKTIDRKMKKSAEPSDKNQNNQTKGTNKMQSFLGKFMDRKKKPVRAPLTISGPSDFRQVAHVGEEGLTVFDEAGDKEKWTQLASMLLCGEPDATTSQEMVNFVNKNGGIDKFIKAANRKTKKVESDSTKKTAVSNSAAAPPPPCAAPPPPCGAPPPAPPSGAPLPIAKGSNAPATPKKSNSQSGDLLSQIQQGKALKKVEVIEHSSDSDDDGEGILGALAQNLANFRQKMNIGDNSDEEEEDDDWSD